MIMENMFQWNKKTVFICFCDDEKGKPLRKIHFELSDQCNSDIEIILR